MHFWYKVKRISSQCTNFRLSTHRSSKAKEALSELVIATTDHISLRPLSLSLWDSVSSVQWVSLSVRPPSHLLISSLRMAKRRKRKGGRKSTESKSETTSRVSTPSPSSRSTLCTGWQFRIVLLKLNYNICCSGDVFLISLRHLQNSIQNSSISGVQSWIVTQYRYLEPLQLPRLPRMSPWSMVSDCTTIYCTCAEGVGRHEIVDRAKKVRSEGNSFSDNKTQLKIHKCPVLPTCPRYYMARCVRCVKAHRGKGTNLTRPCWKVRTFHEGESRKITMASG